MLLWATHGQQTIVRVKILDSASTTGAGKTGLSNASAGLIISTLASPEATPTAYTVAASNVETITTLGTFAEPTSGKCRFREVDATNHPGVYELHIALARFAVTNSRNLLVSVHGASGAAQCDAVIPLPLVDLFSTNESLAASRSEPGQGDPPAAATPLLKLDMLYKWTRNKHDNDGTTTKFYADNGTTVDQKQATSSSGGVVTKAEIISGP